MSLWNMAIRDVSYEDVLQFCELRLAEGTQVDYKRELPKDLAKTLSAFANTMGGLILVGVDEDDESKPILPLSGFSAGRGFAERVYDISQHGLTPGLMPEVSNLLSIPEDPQKFVAVIRVPQSTLSPHAITNGTRVYTRTGSISKPEGSADIARIESLLQRRHALVLSRHELLKRSKNRFAAMRGSDALECAVMWASICPYFVDGPVATIDVCKSLAAGDSVRTTFDGACYSRRHDGKSCKAGTFGIAGDVFLIDAYLEGSYATDVPQFYIAWVHSLLRKVVREATEFYSREGVRVAGPLALMVGLDNAKGTFARFGERRGHTLIDNTIDCEVTVQTSDLLAADVNVNSAIDFEYEIIKQLSAAVDVPLGLPEHYKIR